MFLQGRGVKIPPNPITFVIESDDQSQHQLQLLAKRVLMRGYISNVDNDMYVTATPIITAYDVST